MARNIAFDEHDPICGIVQLPKCPVIVPLLVNSCFGVVLVIGGLEMLDLGKVLSVAEVVQIVTELRRKSRRSKLTRRNLALFDLAVFAGLRVSEICGLRLCDVHLGVSPSIRIPASIAKGSRARTVPLTWDGAALADLTAWLALRRADGACDGDWVVCTRHGRQLDRHAARMIFVRATRNIIGRQVTIHGGRHTFASLALRAKRPLVAVQAAMGHASLVTTSVYAHLIEPEDCAGSLV